MTRSRSRRPRSPMILSLASIALIASACLGSSSSPARPPATGVTGPATASVTGPVTSTAAAPGTAGAGTTPAPQRTADAATPAPTPAPVATGPVAAATPTIAQLVGQKLIVRMDGATPGASLLGRIQRGEVGGVILFSDDISSESQLRALTRELHMAASNAGQPRLLIMLDQEGGAIRRVPWAPPAMSAQAMGADGRTATARTQGTLTGQALHDLGIDVNLAPVADVPSSTSSFLYLQHRTFSFDAATTSRLANAFALGLRDGGLRATMKHFPGLGRAVRNTDVYAVTIKAGITAMQKDLTPYRTAIPNKVPLIMLSNAVYPAWDATNGAGWSRAITKDLLRTELGFTGVSITDSLTGPAKARGVSGASLAVKAAFAGTDLILVTGSEAATQGVYNELLAKAEAHVIGTKTLTASYNRILALKAGS